MSSKVRIEVQNQFGEWRQHTTVTPLGTNVKLALRAALKSPLGRASGKARAVDASSGAVLDVEYA